MIALALALALTTSPQERVLTVETLTYFETYSCAALGVMGGLWLCFLMMRGMYRQATGWVAPAEAARRAPLTGTATAALIFTILGGLLIFTYISRPDFMVVLGPFTAREMVPVNLAVITAGLICGVIARAETTGKVCAWICGALFLFLVLAHA